MLGRGAHGMVLKVQGPGACRHVHAMKLLHCDGPPVLGGAARNTRDMAFAEAALLQRLRHPHIVGCRDVVWDPERQAVRLLLEYMDGGDLQGLIEGRKDNAEPFEPHFARRVLAAVGGALAYVHAAGVLHRDVKPANVLLTMNSQRIKLADFGIAKLLEHTSHARTVVGTPYYLSPEIVSGQAYSNASDAWALGVCIYEVMALRRPFEASNQLALVRRICTESHESLPEDLVPDVRRAAEGLLVKDARARMSLEQALSVSPAVAALAVVGTPPVLPLNTDGAAGVAANGAAPSKVESVASVPALKAQPPVPLDSTVGSSCSSWAMQSHGGSELACSSSFLAFAGSNEPSPGGAAASAVSWCCSEAATAARNALCDEVDDPEELVRALAALERERAVIADRDRGSEAPGAADGAVAREALESELKLRISALRVDAAAMLDSLLEEPSQGSRTSADGAGGLSAGADGANDAMDEEQEDEAEEARESIAPPISPVPRPKVQSRAARAADVEHAFEVATSLGVDTNQSEERIAHKRGMLSLRVKWGGVARFCMLPITVGFDSLVAEVSRRFGLANGTSLPPLSWCEFGESFELKNQACWEECLQRRGLVTQPGRLELCVRSDDPPPRPAHVVRVPRPLSSAAAPMPVFSLTMRRQDLFTWRVSERASHGSAFGRTGQRSLGRANRTPLGAMARSSSSSRCRETLSSSALAAPGPPQEFKSRDAVGTTALAVVGPPIMSEDEHDAAVKVQRLFRNNRDRLRAQASTEEDFFHDFSEPRSPSVGATCSRGYGIAARIARDCNRQTPTGETRAHGATAAAAALYSGVRGLDCSRASPSGEPRGEPRGYAATTASLIGALRGGSDCSRVSPSGVDMPQVSAVVAATGGPRAHVRGARSQQPHRVRAVPGADIRYRTTASAPWPEGRHHVVRGVSSSVLGAGSGPSPTTGAGALPQVSGRAVPRP